MKGVDVYDDALPEAELAWWQVRLRVAELGGQVSQSWPWQGGEGGLLVALARIRAEYRDLVDVILFAINGEHYTEMHRDVGEFIVLYYPIDCPDGPLLVAPEKYVVVSPEEVVPAALWPETQRVEVKANRLVVLDATTVWHQQVVPPSGTRHSVAFKFRRGA